MQADANSALAIALAPGALARFPATDGGVSVEFGRASGCKFELLVWLQPPRAAKALLAGGFWTEWTFGKQLYWIRFQHDCTVFNRAAFAAVEVLEARDPAQRPRGVLWLP